MATYKSRFVILTIAVLTVAAIAPGAFAQSSASANGTATANVIAGIAITANATLRFGDVVTGVGGTVTVDTAGTRTGTAGLAAGGTVGAASFDVTGEPSRTFAVTLPGSATISNGGAGSMTVNAFTSNCAAGICTLSGLGANSFAVGGTLTVGAAQATGTYTGTFPVTVAYN